MRLIFTQTQIQRDFKSIVKSNLKVFYTPPPPWNLPRFAAVATICLHKIQNFTSCKNYVPLFKSRPFIICFKIYGLYQSISTENRKGFIKIPRREGVGGSVSQKPTPLPPFLLHCSWNSKGFTRAQSRDLQRGANLHLAIDRALIWGDVGSLELANTCTISFCRDDDTELKQNSIIGLNAFLRKSVTVRECELYCHMPAFLEYFSSVYFLFWWCTFLTFWRINDDRWWFSLFQTFLTEKITNFCL